MKNDTIRKFACLALCAMAAIVSRSDTFPNAGGDIASEMEWGGPVPSEVTLNQTGTYTVGSDITLTKMILAGGHVTIDLTDPSSGRVTVNPSASKSDGFYISDAGNYTTNFIKGGFWDFSTKASFGITKHSTTAGVAKYASLTVSDGAVMTNCYSFKVAYCAGSCDNQLILTGPGTTVHAPGSDSVVNQYTKDAEGIKASLQILDGARFLFPSRNFHVDQGGGSSVVRVDSSVVVSGTGSLLSGAYLRLGGQNRAGATVSIGNGASLQTTAHLYIGDKPFSSDCRVFVTNNATASHAGVYVAANTNSYGHCLTVADGGTLTCSDFIYLGGPKGVDAAAGVYGNSLIISNANASCNTFRFMDSVSNTLHVCGSDATLTCGTFYFGYSALSGSVTTNATIVLGGKSPAIVVTGSTGIYCGDDSTGTVTFRVPAGGYASTPFRFTGSANFRAGIALDVDLSECLARGKRSAFRSTLVQSGGTLTLNAAQLAAAQASVAAQLEAAECLGSLEKVGNSLVLTVMPPKGLAIIVK